MSETLSTIGPYRIDRELGRGGMGVVYLGHDTRLDRKVAIKALPEHFAEDPERLARFEREAKTLASLSHANIAQIYGVEEHEGRRYLVLEYVDGQTLADRLDAGPLPVDEALEIATQIAAGVEAAHDAGVIHRDLKPGNVIVTPDGRAKVLDFGLARNAESASASGSSMSPTMTTPAQGSPTVPGVILGTAAYMSPEQARGRSVDKRTDIWSFGVILYEMLSGASPFVGETVSDSIGAILHKDPDLDLLPANTPPMARHVIRRCLERDRRRRLQSIGDARIELIDASSHDGSAEAAAAPSRSRWPLALAGVLVGAAGAWGALALFKPDAPALEEHLSVVTAESIKTSDWVPALAISPDGRMIAYIAASDSRGGGALMIRPLASPVAQAVPGVSSAIWPVFSRDGESIVVVSGDRLLRAPAQGGPATTICEFPSLETDIIGLSIGADGNVYFAVWDANAIYRAPLSGGDPTQVLNGATEFSNRSIQIVQALPGGALVFGVDNPRTRDDRPALWLYRPGASPALLIENASNPVYAPSNHLLFARDDVIMRVRFDPSSGRLLDEAAPVFAGALFHEISRVGHYAAADDGTICYLPAGSNSRSVVESSLIITDRAGNSETLVTDARWFNQVDIAPDGEHAAICMFTELGAVDISIWTFEFERKLLSKLTTEAGVQSDPVWSDDGRWVYYSEYERPGSDTRFVGVKRRRADGAGDAELLYAGPRRARIMAPLDDGRRLLVIEEPDDARSPGTRSDISIVDLTGDEPVVTPWLATSANEGDAEASPDGKWIAYTSNASGRNEVYISRADGDRARVQISRNGGSNPEWGLDGAELFFVENEGADGAQLMAAPIALPETETGAPTVGVPVPLFSRSRLLQADYEVFPNGGFAQLLQNEGDDAPITEIRLIRNHPALRP